MNVRILIFSLFGLWLTVTGCRLQKSPPELIGISDKQGKVGQLITLTGHQFGSAPVALFGVASSVVSASVGSHDDNTMVVTVPYIAPGVTQIRVQNDQGTTDPLPFIVQQPGPIVTSVTPLNGLPGTAVVITGDFLNQIKRIQFGGVAASVNDSSARQLTVLIPSGVSRGPSTLALETLGGLYTSSFTIAGTPQITGMSPLKTRPGGPLLIKGVNLSDGVVRINGRFPDKAQTTISDTEIRTVVPAETPSGLVTVTVFDRLIATSADTLQIFQPPVISWLSAQDAVAGEKLIVEGRNLSAVTSLTFGSAPAQFRILSDTQLEAVVPLLTSSTSVTVAVSSIGGTANATTSLFVFLAPSAVVVNPTRQLRGRIVSISGKNLYRVSEVRFNGVSAPITSGRTEGSEVLVSLPDNATSGPVTVVNRAGTAASATPLVVVQKPVVSSVLPRIVQVGQRVIVQGDFLLNAQIFFTDSTKAAVDDGKITDTERWILVPTDAQTGPLRITNEANETTETATVTVQPRQ